MAEHGGLLAAAMLLAGAGWFAIGPDPALLGVLYLAAATPYLVRIDLAEHRLPNRLVLPGYGFALAGVIGGLLLGGSATVALLAGGGYLLFLLTLNLLGGMGMGDVKLGGVLGLVLGSVSLSAAVAAGLLAFLSGGLASLVLLAGRRAARDTRIPFGPFLLLGFWAAVLLVG